MNTMTRIETVDEGGYIHLHLDKLAGIKVKITIEAPNTYPNQTATPPESLALARMQEHAAFAKLILGSAAEDVWNEL